MIACALSFLVEPEAARAAPRGLELVWSAPEGCPSQAEVVAAVERLVGGPEAVLGRPLRADARVERSGERFRLALDWSTAAASAVRIVEGSTCAEVAQAAAVVIALAADPDTNLEELASGRADGAPEPPPLAPPSANPRPAPAPPLRPAEPAAARPARDEASAGSGVRAGAALELGSLPRAAPGVFIGGAFTFASFALVLDALTFVPMDEVVAEGAGTFWLSAVSLRPCYRLPISRFVLAPCAAVELHVMLGEGERVEIPDERWALYGRFGAGVEARFPLGSRLDLVGSGTLLVAPSRPTFVIGTGTPVHEPEAFAGRLTLGFELEL
ncbi:MAG TPA: hypothetical protein VFZ53_10210 [Polyangiaceae bacterium]